MMATAIPGTSPVTGGGALTGALTSATRDGTPVGPGGQLGKNEFLKLLTTQLRYQDPTDPMDGKQLASDLAQFSGLEQLLNINEKLDAQQDQYNSMVQAMNNSTALGVIGHTVVADGDKVILTHDSQGQLTGKVTADLKTSGNATLTLLDKSGKEVGSRSLGHVEATGRTEFDVGSAAANLTSDGVYQYRIDVTDASGKDVPQHVFTVGKIDGLTYGTDGKAQLLMGPLTIDYSAILQILA
jgi:flagellar basal-body rod modification protein FlgD